jgi:hypothetical protein
MIINYNEFFIEILPDSGKELYNILTNEKSNRISIPNNSQYNTNVWTEIDIIVNDNYNTNLLLEYPDTIGTNYRYLQLDNLPGIRRLEPISNRGLKGIKKYTKNDKLIWSIETKYWFEDNPILEDGLVKIIRIYNTDNNVCDIWTNEVLLSLDDKESIKKDQRERIMTYFKSQQSDLFNLLYVYFNEYINEYLSIGNKQLLIDVLTDASINHTSQIVRETLTQQITTMSGTQITVLDGIILELV